MKISVVEYWYIHTKILERLNIVEAMTAENRI
jgi:hypothetical protein